MKNGCQSDQVSDPDLSNKLINIMGCTSRCTICRLKIAEFKSQLPSNIFSEIEVSPVSEQGFEPAYHRLLEIVDQLENNDYDEYSTASYIVQGEQYISYLRDQIQQARSNIDVGTLVH